MTALAIHPVQVQRMPVRQADTDAHLQRMWLHGRSKHTQLAYGAAVGRLMKFLKNRPLRELRLDDLQDFADNLAGDELAMASQILILAAVKSLLGFGHRLGYLTFDVGRALRLPRNRETLADRILSESQVHKMLAAETGPRNQILILFLYATGARVSEAAGVYWRDIQERDGGTGQVTLFGKGSKTRTVILPPALWQQLQEFRGQASPDMAIFANRWGHSLSSHQITRIVHAAAKRAKLKVSPSAHWMRHSHATHAIDRGAPLHLVSSTLGHASLAVTGKYLHARPSDSSSKYLAL